MMSGNIAVLKEEIHSSKEDSPLRDILQRVQIIQRQCAALVNEINSMIDLATDPEVNLAFELEKLRKEYDKLKLKKDTYYKQAADLDAKLTEEREQRKKLQKELRDVTKRIDEDPETFKKAFDGYTDKRAMERNKPNEFRRGRR